MKVFDLDGTLLDSNGIWLKIDEVFIGQFGHTVTNEYNAFVTHATFPLAAKFTREYYNLTVSEAEIMSAWHSLAWDAYANHLPLKPYVRDYLAQCNACGEAMTLFTACEPSLCQAAIERLNIAHYFHEIFFSQQLNLEKKSSDTFRRLSQIMHLPSDECILYDDSPLACKSAKMAGWHVVGVADQYFSAAEAEMRQNCDRYITDFSELLHA